MSEDTIQKTKVDNFFSMLSFRLKNFMTAKKKLDLYLAIDFNVFNFIKPDENRLSDILSNLLDPSGSHGQNDMFLKEFLKVIELDSFPNNLINCKVIREVSTSYIKKSQRRIDIILDFGDSGIGIENKPWAIEQEDQIKDYCEHLKRKYKDKFFLIYLSGDGSEPSSIEDVEKKDLQKQNKLKVLSYSENFRKWLESCYKECNSEKIRWFIKDFIEYIDNNFKYQPANEGELVC